MLSCPWVISSGGGGFFGGEILSCISRILLFLYFLACESPVPVGQFLWQGFICTFIRRNFDGTLSWFKWFKRFEAICLKNWWGVSKKLSILRGQGSLSYLNACLLVGHQVRWERFLWQKTSDSRFRFSLWLQEVTIFFLDLKFLTKFLKANLIEN